MYLYIYICIYIYIVPQQCPFLCPANAQRGHFSLVRAPGVPAHVARLERLRPEHANMTTGITNQKNTIARL